MSLNDFAYLRFPILEQGLHYHPYLRLPWLLNDHLHLEISNIFKVIVISLDNIAKSDIQPYYYNILTYRLSYCLVDCYGPRPKVILPGPGAIRLILLHALRADRCHLMLKQRDEMTLVVATILRPNFQDQTIVSISYLSTISLALIIFQKVANYIFAL